MGSRCTANAASASAVVTTATNAASTSTAIAMGNPVLASPPTAASTALAPSAAANTSPIAMATEIGNRPALAVPAPSLSALADPDVARTAPQTLEQLKSVKHALRQWLSVIAPLERLSDAWRSTATLGDRAKMKQWSHSINDNYYPLLFCVMEKYESGLGIIEACDTVQKEKGSTGWVAFIERLPKRKLHPKMKEYTEMLLDRDGKLSAEITAAATAAAVPAAAATPAPA